MPGNRKDKIQLLKDLLHGKISLNDIMPEKAVIWFEENGIYTWWSSNGELIFNKEQLKEYSKRRPWLKSIIFRPAEDCEPLPPDPDFPNT